MHRPIIFLGVLYFSRQNFNMTITSYIQEKHHQSVLCNVYNIINLTILSFDGSITCCVLFLLRYLAFLTHEIKLVYSVHLVC